MKVLAIETSCDETAIAIVGFKGGSKSPGISILGNALYSQASLHAHLGGVVPMLAKREHGKNLIPLLESALRQAKLWKLHAKEKPLDAKTDKKVRAILEREPELREAFMALVPRLSRPTIDAIAVTHGPGLEPALWVGVNIAKALALIWNKPIIPVNHMEGHVFSSLLVEQKPKQYLLSKVSYPAVALLISGGHTELIHIKKPGKYSLLGATRDDAAGEAFDKVARMLGLPYPGGPEISKLAEEARTKKLPRALELPRPMLTSKDLEFSFAGLKTAVLYKLKDMKLDDATKRGVAREFEDAVTEVLVTKTKAALLKTKSKTLIAGGGVAANRHIRAGLKSMTESLGNISCFLPAPSLTTDNAVMIAVAGFLKQRGTKKKNVSFKADGNLRLSSNSSKK
ncbi:tRNA (adenosine(37)-N6)-threonylcarbamoyltransferase complex transferase subunit TsaD [Candidatus Parcubacteria bacterium]|nr:tRNA (adenosine(37)-N6)-threonylcarbamoyltransferase complex transferase subunit TsaD [Candidatus Parcubacteria bacterium]